MIEKFFVTLRPVTLIYIYMKKSIHFLCVAVVVAALSSCTTYQYTSRSAAIRPTTISSEALGAEIEVDFQTKVTASSEPQVLRSDAIQEAQYKAIQEYGIDVVVDPIYKIRFNMFSKKAYQATITGYAGRYKQVPLGIDAMREKEYTVEEIEKYKLLTDPSFYRYYYQPEQPKKEATTNYYFNMKESGSSLAPAPAPAPAPAAPSSLMVRPISYDQPALPKFDYYQSKKLRDAGISLTVCGAIVGGFIGPMCVLDEEYHYGHYCTTDEGWAACWSLLTIGCAGIAAGIPMASVGAVRMKQSKVNLAFGGTGSGLGMRLTF